MKTLYRLLFITLFAILPGGCGFFKKMSKNKSASSQRVTKQLEANQLILKSANKETQTYTWWNDSLVFQYRNIREYAVETTLKKMVFKEKLVAQHKSVVKEKAPSRLWIIAGAVVLVIGILLFNKWFVKKSSYFR